MITLLLFMIAVEKGRTKLLRQVIINLIRNTGRGPVISAVSEKNPLGSKVRV